MSVSREPDSEVTVETKLDEIDEDDTTFFMSVEIEVDVPPVENCLQNYGREVGRRQWMVAIYDAFR